MIIKRLSFFLVLFCFVSPFGLWAQSGTSTYFDMSGFPLWARDLRRGEIIAFGSFPFAYLVANFTFDSYRFMTNDRDRRFAPKPFNAAGTIEKTQDEKIKTLWIAAGGAVLIALIDYGIVRSRRNRLERESRNLPEGAPIIIRSPLYGEEEETFLESVLPVTESP